MQTKDHLALGRRISQKLRLQGICKTAFILGNIAPDINLFSYLIGFKSFVPAGHHCKFALAKCEKLICRIENICNKQLHYYKLGVLMHYSADAFTYSHSDNYPCKYSPHAAYEKKLHTEFKTRVAESSGNPLEIVSNACEFICNMQKNYTAERHCTETDCEYILNVTETAAITLCEKRKSTERLKNFSNINFKLNFPGKNGRRIHPNAKN